MDEKMERERRISVQLLTRHDHNLSDHNPLTRENCSACVLNGYVSREQRADPEYPKDAPDYAGWGRVYVQAGQYIPLKWAKSFVADQLNSDNLAYAAALRADLVYFGCPNRRTHRSHHTCPICGREGK